MDNKKLKWIKRLGIAGFLFFLVKGILWLVFGAAVWKWLKGFLLLFTVVISPGQAHTHKALNGLRPGNPSVYTTLGLTPVGITKSIKCIHRLS